MCEGEFKACAEAVVLAAMLTLFAFNIIPRGALRPGFLYTANAEGGGKTLLARLAIEYSVEEISSVWDRIDMRRTYCDGKITYLTKASAPPAEDAEPDPESGNPFLASPGNPGHPALQGRQGHLEPP